ncbi:ATP-dependent zinc metalloprotease FTSH 5, mitochondrial [Hordeum vulgare]|nr:ATP-dependent zinc metalloprotease FTSH 5, mitochondrial [Hordeum vulgare]
MPLARRKEGDLLNRTRGKTSLKADEKSDASSMALQGTLKNMMSQKEVRKERRSKGHEEKMKIYLDLQTKKLHMEEAAKRRKLDIEEALELKKLEIEATNDDTKAKGVALAIISVDKNHMSPERKAWFTNRQKEMDSLSDSSSSDDSDIDELLQDDDVEMMSLLVDVQAFEDRVKLLDQRRGSKMGRLTIYRNRALGHEHLMRDYFAEVPTYPPRLFRRSSSSTLQPTKHTAMCTQESRNVSKGKQKVVFEEEDEEGYKSVDEDIAYDSDNNPFSLEQHVIADVEDEDEESEEEHLHCEGDIEVEDLFDDDEEEDMLLQ